MHKKNLCKKVLQHLKGDSLTWKKLSEKAKEEYKSDRKLMRKIRHGS